MNPVERYFYRSEKVMDKSPLLEGLRASEHQLLLLLYPWPTGYFDIPANLLASP